MFQGGTYVIQATGANGAPGLRLDVQASFFLVGSSSEPLNIRFYDDSLNSEGLSTGVIPVFKRKNRPYGRVDISTASGGAGTAYLICSDEEVDISASAGTVMVQDVSSGIYNAFNGFAFQGSTQQIGVAASASFFKIRNPAASGINAYLKRARAFSVAGSNNLLYKFSADATDYTAGNVGSKLVGSGLVPKCVLTTGANAAGGDAVMTQFGIDTLQPNIQGSLDLSDKEIIVKPGFAFIAACFTLNVDLKGMVEWFEK